MSGGNAESPDANNTRPLMQSTPAQGNVIDPHAMPVQVLYRDLLMTGKNAGPGTGTPVPGTCNPGRDREEHRSDQADRPGPTVEMWYILSAPSALVAGQTSSDCTSVRRPQGSHVI